MRTLVVGQKFLDEKSRENLLKQLNAIKVDNISNAKKEAKLNALYDKNE